MLNGISARLIESHYEHDYGGTVERLNAIAEETRALEANGLAPGALHRLKRDELELLNSMLLHELYFDNLTPKPGDPAEDIRSALKKRFGSLDRWMPRRIRQLGTDGFGRSEDRADLRNFFEVDARFIALATLAELAQDGQLDRGAVAQAILDFGINADKPNPAVS